MVIVCYHPFIMSQPRPPRFHRIGSGARRAMWRELETMYTNTPNARAVREKQDLAFTRGERLENIPLLSPEPDETFVGECATLSLIGTSDFTVTIPSFILSR